MISMLTVGLTYTALGVLIWFTRNKNVLRLRGMFIAVGILNILLWVLSLLVPDWKTFLNGVSWSSIVVFCFLQLLEFNRDYRDFRKKHEKYEKEMEEFFGKMEEFFGKKK